MSKTHKHIQYFERINLYCPMEERLKWFDWFYENGYRLMRSGPKVTKFPKADINRCHIIAEREIEKP